MRLTEDPELRRSRLAVLLRPLLLVPPLVVAAAWAVVAAVAFPIAWAAAVATARVPSFLHRTLAAALTYVVQVDAWASLVSARYPWPHRRDRHPVRLSAERGRHPRWAVLLRPALALPTIVLASAFVVVRWGTAVAVWCVALALGRTTEGLRELGAFCLRYTAETAAYLLLLSPAYPRLASPAPADDQPAVEPQAAQ